MKARRGKDQVTGTQGKGFYGEYLSSHLSTLNGKVKVKSSTICMIFGSCLYLFL